LLQIFSGSRASPRLRADIPHEVTLAAVPTEDVVDRLTSVVNLGSLIEVGTEDTESRREAAAIVDDASRALDALRPYGPRTCPPLQLLREEVGARLTPIAISTRSVRSAVDDPVIVECADAILSCVSVLRRMVGQRHH